MQEKIEKLLRDLDRTDFRGRPTLTDEGYADRTAELKRLKREHPAEYLAAEKSLSFEHWREQDERHSRTFNSH